MTCPKCGNRLPSGSKFCQYCGSKIHRHAFALYNVLVAALLTVFVFSTAILGYLYTQAAIELQKAELEADNLKAKLQSSEDTNRALINQKGKLDQKLRDTESRLSEYQRKVSFFDNEVGILINTSDEYHTAGCPQILLADEFMVFVISECEKYGFAPCPKCH